MPGCGLIERGGRAEDGRAGHGLPRLAAYGERRFVPEMRGTASGQRAAGHGLLRLAAYGERRFVPEMRGTASGQDSGDVRGTGARYVPGGGKIRLKGGLKSLTTVCGRIFCHQINIGKVLANTINWNMREI